MANIYKIETKNGREFRVVVENKSQLNRLIKAKRDSQGKYEEITTLKPMLNGVHDTKSFLAIAKNLV